MATAGGTLLAAGAAVGALWFTGQSLRSTNAQLGMSQQTAVTDRFRLAAEQLASDQINVRLSGIYLLERLAIDSPPDHTTVYSLLAAFLRTQTSATDCPTQPPDPLAPDNIEAALTKAVAPVDVQAALTVIGRRDTAPEKRDQERPEGPDLRRACLATVQLSARGGHLGGGSTKTIELAARFAEAYRVRPNLDHANLTGANLSNATLAGASLRSAYLGYADLDGASFMGADLTRAYLATARLHQANLVGANLTRALLNGADLTGADLTGANLTGASLVGANLQHTWLDGAHLTGVHYDNLTRWPDGFTPPPSRR
ncbi:pentapeptide repeat-containing protein [Nocardia amikacinitolerans]|uniref:pentapeptide repeat-containing protein n=1 Tax=Nocardia amikacinitolerans TaxID=756689 RepID=UPI003689ABD6